MNAAQQKNCTNPTRGRCLLQQGQPIAFLFLFVLSHLGLTVISRVILWVPLFHFERSIEHTEYQYGRSAIESPDDRVGNYTPGGIISNADFRQEERENKAHDTAGIAEKALNTVG